MASLLRCSEMTVIKLWYEIGLILEQLHKLNLIFPLKLPIQLQLQQGKELSDSSHKLQAHML